MKGLPAVVIAEYLKDVMYIQHLITIELGSATYRWADGGMNIYYSGHWYIAKNIKFDEAGGSIAKQVDSITFIVDNVDKVFSNIALTESVKGRLFLIERVLLDRNLAVIGAPDTLFVGYLDSVEIDRRTAKNDVFNHLIKWKMLTPKRVHPPTCGWVFKGVECAFSGNVFTNPKADIAAGFTRSLGSYNWPLVDDYLTDLTSGGTFLASSEFGAGNSADKAFDDDITTYWCPSPASFPQWIRVQFSVAKTIRKYALTTHYNAGVSTVTDWYFQGSDDASAWTNLDQIVGASWMNLGSNVSNRREFELRTPATYIYFRLYIAKGLGYGCVRELELIGTVDQVNDVDYVYTTGTGIVADDLETSTVPIANDVTITSVTVRVRAKQTTASARTMAGRVRVNGVNYDASTITPTTGFTNWDFVWVQNPGRSAAWRYGDFNRVDLCINGTASADTEYAADYEATKGFDDLFTTYWMSANSALPHWLRYQLSVAKFIYAYSIKASFSGNYDPKDFKLQGSPDGSSWYDLDTRTGITFAAEQKKYFQVASPTSYLYYRLYITAVQTGTTYATVEEFELFEYDIFEGIGYMTPANAGGNRLDVSQCYRKIIFTATSCDQTPERCVLLCNYPNFGGFEWIPEMTVKEIWWGERQKMFTGPY